MSKAFLGLGGTAFKRTRYNKLLSRIGAYNEYLSMRMAKAVGLRMPAVHRLFWPEPVYLIERFHRMLNARGHVERMHGIDTCQLLNKDPQFKYKSANLTSLLPVIENVRVRGAARQWLFEWVVFNILMGKGFNHLKNISFMVANECIAISPCYAC